MGLSLKYGYVSVGEITLSYEACQNLDNIALAGVARFMLELSQEELIEEQQCGGTRPPFESLEEFMIEKHKRDKTKR